MPERYRCCCDRVSPRKATIQKAQRRYGTRGLCLEGFQRNKRLDYLYGTRENGPACWNMVINIALCNPCQMAGSKAKPGGMSLHRELRSNPVRTLSYRRTRKSFQNPESSSNQRGDGCGLREDKVVRASGELLMTFRRSDPDT